ncbi:hypothetical protein [Methylobacterium sp. Leaf118]|uniref:hypothetical protein n=1 Tax=Methylobacterium sp. Leaf118 TaxID=2876562 RepID=UPI001E298775|nr:hypothetical protein [Methylobacterium sp. Leaf118]
MSVLPLTLDERIDGEGETIMYTCAPQAVKAEARKRRDVLLRQRDAARAQQIKPPRAANPYCVRCGGFGYLIFAVDDCQWDECGCTPSKEARP